jgi:hypothetical protein
MDRVFKKQLITALFDQYAGTAGHIPLDNFTLGSVMYHRSGHFLGTGHRKMDNGVPPFPR